MTAYDDLMAFQRTTQALGGIAERLGWDRETMMPRGATYQRSEEFSAIQSVLHSRQSDPRIGMWLEEIDGTGLGDVGAAQLRHIRRHYERAIKVPEKLATQLAQKTSLAHGIWAEARANEDTATFLPALKEVLDLKREEGAALAAGGDVYDAMLQDYEPGATAAQLEAMFGALRPALVTLREAALAKPAPQAITGEFDEALQMKLSRILARTFGYDMSKGRVDKAVHPFSSGSGQDVRITTRTNLIDPFNCFYSTIHEVGHAAYEQAIDEDFLLTPLGQGVSMGVHESQSRIYENQLGRSRAFTGWLFGQMRDLFGDFGIADEDGFYAAVNRLNNGFIRTEADEVQYNLHVLMRFDLERALISGDLAVRDLEAAWNDRFAKDFGFAVDKPSNGVLQDVHWSEGLFGYFATYTLGNVYAGCLHQALRGDLPNLDDDLSKGDTSRATDWLRERLQRFGGLYKPRDLIERASSMAPTETPLITYLQAKFSGIYGL